MTHRDWIEYFLLNVTAGASIATDACILVVMKFREMDTLGTIARWAFAVGTTHVVLPLMGFIGGWWLIERYRLSVAVYSVGALFLAVLIGFVIAEGVSHSSDDLRIAHTSGLAFWGSVAWVSLDAFLAGPGKVVMLQRYAAWLAWLSFFMVGAVVVCLTLGAGGVAWLLRSHALARPSRSPRMLARFVTFGIIGEILVFSFFLVWSAAKVFAVDAQRDTGSLAYPIAGAMAVTAALMSVFLPRIWHTQLARVVTLLRADE